MKNVRIGLLMAVALSGTAQGGMAQGRICDVRSYGAKGDGISKDTAAIQQAIDACAATGERYSGKDDLSPNNVVLLKGGTFVSGPIELKSGVTLRVSKGTTLLGSPDHADYPKKVEFRAPGYEALITATDADSVGIDGGGVIDGNGKSWWDSVRGTKDAGVLGSDNSRPRGVVFDHSKHIRIEGVTIQNSPYWQVVPYYSNDVLIQNVRILADPHSPNTDAIDPFSSSNVTIDHVFADVGDDNIAIKSGMINSPGPDAPSKNITIRDCDFEHGHGVSIGSEIAGGAQNVLVERVHFKGTAQGIRIKANRDRGADVSKIVFRDITMEDVKTSILISEYYPKALPEGEVAAEPIGRLTPFFHDITIENVKSVNSGWAGVVIGLPESPVKNVVMKNVDIQATKGMQIAYATISGTNVHITATEGRAITVAPNATASFSK
jgi:polygalacturonase